MQPRQWGHKLGETGAAMQSTAWEAHTRHQEPRLEGLQLAAKGLDRRVPPPRALAPARTPLCSSSCRTCHPPAPPPSAAPRLAPSSLLLTPLTHDST